MKKVKRGNTYLYFNDEKSLEFFDIVENNRYKLLKVLKDDQRSYVAVSYTHLTLPTTSRV